MLCKAYYIDYVNETVEIDPLIIGGGLIQNYAKYRLSSPCWLYRDTPETIVIQLSSKGSCSQITNDVCSVSDLKGTFDLQLYSERLFNLCWMVKCTQK